jgi:SAM-dependent methyltransferase
MDQKTDHERDLECLKPYLTDPSTVRIRKGLPTAAIGCPSANTRANAAYFDNPEWALGYFLACHRSAAFRERWLRAAGPWDARIVVDIGCGPGNLFATMGGRPALLIGVDVSRGALGMARRIGYVPLLADAHRLPLVSGFADIVAVNATLHHCDDMAEVLGEAARLVRPGGLLVCDHDPQLSAWWFRGAGLVLWEARLPVYRWLGRASRPEQRMREATEAHHRPGSGVTRELFLTVLRPRGFDVRLFPHNHVVGASALDGQIGVARLKYRLAQRLSGLTPGTERTALTLMCVARRRDGAGDRSPALGEPEAPPAFATRRSGRRADPLHGARALTP